MKDKTLVEKAAVGGGLVLTVLALALAPVQGRAQEQIQPDRQQDWSTQLGAGAFYQPDYEGSDDYEVMPVPLMEISWRDRIRLTTMGGPGIYAKLYGNDEFTVDLGIRYDGGRAEDDNDALAGLGDMDVGAVAVGSVRYDLGPLELGFELAGDLGGDRDGLAGTLEAEYALPVLEKGRLTLTPHVTFVNEDYMDNSFGITAAQSASSTLGLAQYDPGAGIRDAGVTVGFGYQMMENVMGIARVDYSRLMSGAADSPLVDGQGSANQLSAGIGIIYQW